ncbi:hypothetical protein [Spirosoma sp. KNUC1025]|uniref:hypothetical protein n=1 Tax=Spirosoma sp. KNUC1025 TaxID=2894082 RepID=UPI003870B490|nr:hypothetical protein LN737_21110 [Spirosoma sp. KNUC1025]
MTRNQTGKVVLIGTRNVMNYRLLVILLFPFLVRAQSETYGFGPYQLELTTPDTLQQAGFAEQSQSYVKGTIALPCTHIRTYKADTTKLAGVTVTNLFVVFYDNRLARLSCDNTDSLQQVLIAEYGKGAIIPVRQLSLCAHDKPVTMWGEVWNKAGALAYVMYSNGYTADCQPQKSSTFCLSSQRLTALSSDCDIKNLNPLAHEFEKELLNRRN